MDNEKPTVVFILGGPGSGKGTQSDNIKKYYDYVHLSAGDLLREERKSGSEKGNLIESYIVQGTIVPSEITISLLKAAMEKAGWKGKRFLIDGFPRNFENMSQWEKIMSDIVFLKFVIYLECDEEIMTKRIMSRSASSGRSDDNVETLKKRFATHNTEQVVVLDYYRKLNKLITVDGGDTIENVWSKLKGEFEK